MENSLLDEYNTKIKEIKNANLNTTRSKILEVYTALEELSKSIEINCTNPSIELIYWNTINTNIIKNEVEAIRSTIKPTAEFEEFTSKREDLAKKYCKRLKNDAPDLITTPSGQQFQFDTKGQKNFNGGLKKLLKEYDDVLIKTNKREILVDKFVKKEIERPNYYKLDMKDVGDEISLDSWFTLFHDEGLFNED